MVFINLLTTAAIEHQLYLYGLCLFRMRLDFDTGNLLVIEQHNVAFKGEVMNCFVGDSGDKPERTPWGTDAIC
jgi:hypothetical protein